MPLPAISFGRCCSFSGDEVTLQLEMGKNGVEEEEAGRLALYLLPSFLQTPTLAHYSKYTEKEIEHATRKMACVVLKASTHKLKASTK